MPPEQSARLLFNFCGAKQDKYISYMIPFVHIDRVHKFSSPTLPGPSLEKLESTFRSASRWRDRWKNVDFQAAVRDSLGEHAGLILIGSEMPFEMPPPFNEMFEPIEIGSGRGGNAADLDVLSEESHHRQRRLARLRWGIIGLGVVLSIVPLLFLPASRVPVRQIFYVVFAFAICGIAVFAMTLWAPVADRWFIIPGALAIAHRPTHRNRTPGVTVLTPKDTCLILRYMKSGSTEQLVLEFWTAEGSLFRSAVTEREAIGILAAWQSLHPPPPDSLLKELTMS